MNDETHSGAEAPDDLAPLLPVGAVLNRYVIQRLIGRGGMGEVYEAIHQDIKKRVAIKTLDPSAGRNAEARARFLREGEAASRIVHPHIVSVSDVGTHDGMLFMVMEYLEGEDLDARLARVGRLAVEPLADIMVPVLAAVSTAHAAGVVHRDLKPSNIFLARTPVGDEVPKVLDFGISKITDATAASAGGHNLTRTSAVMGTPLYMAPEQVKSSKGSDARSDQYSLGVILYQCATGALPFQAETVFHLMSLVVSGECKAPRELEPSLSEGFDALVRRAMATAPEQRFASVAELGRALLPFASEETRVLFRRAFGAGETGAYGPLADATGALRVNAVNPRASEVAFASTMSQAAGERPTEAMPAPAPSSRSRAPLLGVGALLLLGGIGATLALRSPPPTPPASAVRSARAPEPSASVAPAGAPSASVVPGEAPSASAAVLASATASAADPVAPSAAELPSAPVLASASAAVLASATASAAAQAPVDAPRPARTGSHSGAPHTRPSHTVRPANAAPILR